MSAVCTKTRTDCAMSDKRPKLLLTCHGFCSAAAKTNQKELRIF